MQTLWQRLGEGSSFEVRVRIAEDFLAKRVFEVNHVRGIESEVTYLFRSHGAVAISQLARRSALSVRQFERRFRQATGASPKMFARIARFQAAVDAKLAAPQRTWLDIAHSFGYHDQMHMIHDFEQLGRKTPSQLLAEMGDVRPPALVSADH
jgi:AraC-like DNA-binding protein